MQNLHPPPSLPASLSLQISTLSLDPDLLTYPLPQGQHPISLTVLTANPGLATSELCNLRQIANFSVPPFFHL